MKKKEIRNLKGFTLIELLAVIVILAIIALIAVPQVLKILNKSRLSATEDSVYGIIKSAESYVTNFMLENNGTLPSESLEFDCDANGCNLKTSLTGYNLTGLDKLDFKGTKPKSGTVIISDNGNNITTTDLVINNFVCGYIGGKSSCIKKGEYETKENGTIIYFNPGTGKQCTDYVEANSDTENKSGCMKWYVFNDSEDSVAYNLLLDHNTTQTIAYNSSNNNRVCKEACEQLSSDTSTWLTELNPRLMKSKEVAIITNKEDFDETNHNSWYYFDTLTQTSPNPYPQPSQYGWLYDRTDVNCTSSGCLNNATGNNGDNSYYWLQSNVSNNYVTGYQIVPGYMANYNVNTTNRHGVRPVITVEKSKIS